ncbi:hypothetical protein [Haloarcula salinisoli]|uniref:Uncharacterized protein n=1 Tax=Haloarcula salinisoli TaxID=2487746 RepID=A0A8J8C8L8_9EURY|nr:hypothetical protein [Halomicroarcula salinisoli]MBX0287235.1 hypothetical protein [Halomicroarcula salinisoli]MBX0304541.1 hypothetical protein [Halomicroarcula salinisoli]
MSWVEQARSLLHNNESIREEVRIGSGGVVVTNQRLLVFTPGQPGANFRQVDRPNVESVERRTSGDRKFLMPGLKAGIVGLTMVAFGYAFNFDDFAEGIALDSGTGAAGAVGVGGLLGLIQTAIELFALFDELLRIFGGLALAFSAVALGVYVWSREDQLVVSVAGEGKIELPATDDVDDALLDRLRTAIQPGGAAPAATPGGFGEEVTETKTDDPLGDNIDFGDGAATTGQGAGESRNPEPVPSASVEGSESTEPVPVDGDAVENVLEAMDDTESEGATEDGTLDLSDPKDR